jgi:hypothetical protein
MVSAIAVASGIGPSMMMEVTSGACISRLRGG